MELKIVQFVGHRCKAFKTFKALNLSDLFNPPIFEIANRLTTNKTTSIYKHITVAIAIESIVKKMKTLGDLDLVMISFTVKGRLRCQK